MWIAEKLLGLFICGAQENKNKIFLSIPEYHGREGGNKIHFQKKRKIILCRGQGGGGEGEGTNVPVFFFLHLFWGLFIYFFFFANVFSQFSHDNFSHFLFFFAISLFVFSHGRQTRERDILLQQQGPLFLTMGIVFCQQSNYRG